MTIKKKKGGRPTNRPTMEELTMLYSSMTAPQIADHYGVKESTVRTWLYNYRYNNYRKEVH